MQIFKPFGVILSFFMAGTAFAHDWPQFLGPDRNGTYRAKDLARVWPKEGPPKAWEKRVGQGFSGPVAAQGQLILFHRVGDQERIDCWQAASGESVWHHEYPTQYRDDFGFDEGPRSTPTIAGGQLFTLGAEGTVHCLELESGKVVWKLSVKELFKAGKGFFGLVCSPLVEGNAVLLNIGGENGAGIVALDKANGQLLWKATDHEASYSSPVAADFGGKRLAVFLTREGLVALRPETGAIELNHPWRARMHASVNAATPLVFDRSIFISASYETGALLMEWKDGKFAKVWASDEALSNHYATSAHREDYLYGFHGRQEYGPSLRCVEARTGQVRWSEDRFPAGTVTLANDLLLVMLEDGRLLLAEASPARFQLLGQAQIQGNTVRAHPALAHGRFYARSKDRLVCVDLR